MLPDLSVRLSRVVEQMQFKKKLERDLPAVEKELQEKSSQFAALTFQLEKEKVDVEKLERTSITALFYSVLGSREQQLEKERQELLSTQLSYQQVKHQMEYLDRERQRLLQQLVKFADIEDEYESLLTEKEDLLRQSDQLVASKLVEYAEQTAKLESEIKEVSEAITAGNDVISGLDQVIQALESAENWGTWDMLGGGIISTAIKHSRIDEARNFINIVQAKMSRFKRELVDVREEINIQVDIGEFECFADYFFDSLIFDWVVQSKISDSLAQSRWAKSNTVQFLEELDNLKTISENKKRDLQEKRAKIIANA